MGADHGWLKGGGRLLSFLEHDGDDIVSDVALPFHLDGSTGNVTETHAVTAWKGGHRTTNQKDHGAPDARHLRLLASPLSPAARLPAVLPQVGPAPLLPALLQKPPNK